MTKLNSRLLASVTFAVTASILASCGGGGSSPSTTAVAVVPPPPPVSQAPTFTSNVFAPRENLVAQCAVPRSGNDPDGDPYPDRTGSTLIEKFWLRSWSDETYLWNDEIQDVNPNSIASRTAYFDILKTEELSLTGSRVQKDDFHFSESTEDFFERRNSTASSGYGFTLTSLGPVDEDGRPTTPRDFRILYTETDTPAAALSDGQVNFPRGTRILEIDGADFVDGFDAETLNAGLFPATAGETHTFKVIDSGSNEPRTFEITSADIVEKPVNRTQILDVGEDKVGYMLFNTFSPLATQNSLADAFKILSDENVDDLVLDLRYNGGGLIAFAAQLGYMIAGPERTSGKTAALLQYNEAAGNRDPISGEINEPFPFYDIKLRLRNGNTDFGDALDTVNLPRVFILSTEGTCSASELIINSLRGIDYEVILIGDTTCGKPYGFLPTDNCGQTYYTIQFQSVNDKGIGDYSDGFSPIDNTTNQFSQKIAGCTVSDDITKELGDKTEALLATALHYRENGSCPAASSQISKLSAPKFSQVNFKSHMKSINAPADTSFAANIDSYLDATRFGE